MTKAEEVVIQLRYYTLFIVKNQEVYLNFSAKNQTAALDCLTEYLFKLTEYYAMSTLLIESNSSRISFEGFCVSSETATFTASARKKPRTSE